MKLLKQSDTENPELCGKERSDSNTLERLGVSSRFERNILRQVPQETVETSILLNEKNTLTDASIACQSTSMMHTFQSNSLSSHRTRACANMVTYTRNSDFSERHKQQAYVKKLNLSATEQNRCSCSVRKIEVTCT